jgi:dolichol-phosphate mannosyltransferase
MVDIVIAAHNEASSLPRLLPQVLAVADRCGVAPHVYVVDDGSTDDTSTVVERLATVDGRIELVQLSRNFGHQAALLAGLRLSTADAVISMDGDGQHPAEVIEKLIASWDGGGDVVHTLRTDSADVSRSKRITSRAFYRMFRSLSGLDLQPGMADFRLLSAQARSALLAASGTQPFVRGAAVWIGFEQRTVPYEAGNRCGGSSSYTLRRMLTLARDGIVGFSVRPLWILSAMGAAASAIAFLVSAQAIVIGIFSDGVVPGWASTLAYLTMLQGLMFLLLGGISVYLGAVYAEVLDRPTYLVRRATNPARQEDADSRSPHERRELSRGSSANKRPDDNQTSRPPNAGKGPEDPR